MFKSCNREGLESKLLLLFGKDYKPHSFNKKDTQKRERERELVNSILLSIYILLYSSTKFLGNVVITILLVEKHELRKSKISEILHPRCGFQRIHNALAQKGVELGHQTG